MDSLCQTQPAPRLHSVAWLLPASSLFFVSLWSKFPRGIGRPLHPSGALRNLRGTCRDAVDNPVGSAPNFAEGLAVDSPPQHIHVEDVIPSQETGFKDVKEDCF